MIACRRWPLQACSGSPFNSTSPSPGVSRRLISRNKGYFFLPRAVANNAENIASFNAEINILQGQNRMSFPEKAFFTDVAKFYHRVIHFKYSGAGNHPYCGWLRIYF
ncbi:hypothetical protein LN650_18290 [Klebsiella pneumoniae subsp. pneumoniae]|nr:hypothetical protein [Klebsiella pneumoniae subsp. pneumoniae]